ncbi:uncharacterized protein LOC111250023 [Varroa destructor]|uniref:Uncharacterized protein n=1 Tax=Varroa destructor TaxID=109461 RepID=A0A7M7MGJ7_VARDE|nr:uncharacterized protein LOC111250023 [Varroa destructor]XP_022660345.1 uncharacterized protein LOC111250023 [Varroa destructor]XP_022660346.1 uncharacterized protein LOC111250023 [Varroa destructor]XP_022660347.1 uncharacterized protein LOC111250023 [Varroa destructor]
MEIPWICASVFLLAYVVLVLGITDGSAMDGGDSSATDPVNTETATNNKRLNNRINFVTENTSIDNLTEVKLELPELVMNRTVAILMRFMDQDTRGRFESKEIRQLALNTKVPCLMKTLRDIDQVVLNDTLIILERHVTCVQEVLDSPGGINDTTEFQAFCSRDDEQIDKAVVDAFKTCHVFIGPR